MAKTKLGGVFTTDVDGGIQSTSIISTENVCGLIFDTKIAGGLEKAFTSGSAAAKAFANGNVVELNSTKYLDEVGLDSTVMGGLPYYHLNMYFKLAGSNVRLFVSFMDSTTDTNFEAIEKMQLAANGIIYQIGVWTGEPIATKSDDGVLSVAEGSLIYKLQAQAEVLGGKIGSTNFEGNAPVNILLNAPILNEAVVDYQKLPDLSAINAPKVSILLGQAATDDVHKIQLTVNNMGDTANYAVVGNIGATLACLAIAPANESIAHVASFNLAAAITDAELGFGNLTQTSKAWDKAVSFNNIKTIGYLKRDTYLHQKGYIFLTNYDGLEGSIFFSSDQTLTNGDYRTIARCRVMHKSRRTVRQALLPYVNNDIEVDTTTGQLSSSTVTEYQNLVLNALDNSMVEPGTTVPQISGRTCNIDADQNVLENDQLLISYSLVPRGTTTAIFVTEGFTSTISTNA